MKRHAESDLDDWLRDPRRKPLVIRGARQVGKSTLVRNFAKAAGRDLIEINLERHPSLDSIFETTDLTRIINAIEALSKGARITPATILFLDEVQATPHALAALRYFHEDRPDLPVVAAGSLLEFTLADHDFSMPVGRIRYLHLGPMSFLEYLQARQLTSLIESVTTLSVGQSPDTFFHQQLLGEFRRYAFVGGMPEAITTYIETESLARVRDVQENIIGTYKDDFAKYALRNDLVNMHQVLDQAARSVGEKIKFSNILPDEQSRTTRRLLDLLVQARVLSRVVHSDANGLPLGAGIDARVFKLLLLDVGLLNALTGLPWRENEGHDHLNQVNNGSVAEQLVGQELIASDMRRYDPSLHYWLREGRKGNAEVDFVVAHEGVVLPIEVKAGKSGTLRSLMTFASEKKVSRAVRFDANPPSLQRLPTQKGTVELLSLPLYAASQIGRF